MSIGIPVDVLRSMAADSATGAFHIAGTRGFNIPQDIIDARAALAELDAIARSTLPPSLPSTDPKKLRAGLIKIATDARAQTDLLEAAREARPLLISRAVQATRAATAGWASALATEWDTTWADFVTVRPSPKLRAVLRVKPLLSRGFTVLAVCCSGYFRVSGIGAPMSSKARRWVGVGQGPGKVVVDGASHDDTPVVV